MKQIAIHPLSQKIDASITVPGCIGYTIRALNIAALTKGSVKILNPLKSDDTYSMMNALIALGISIEEGQGYFTVHGDIGDIKNRKYTIDIGISGRSARTLLALLSIVPGEKILTCSEEFKKRPVGDLVDALRQIGAKISYIENKGFLPVKISSQDLQAGNVTIKGELSSQYLSALLMIAPAVNEIHINVVGNQSSKPYIDMTIDIMKKFGVNVVNNKYKQYTIRANQQYKNLKTYLVEPEATSASYFLAIAAITNSKIKITGFNPDSLQGDLKFLKILERMGCKVKKSQEDNWIEIEGPEELSGISINMNDTPDLVPTLAVVASFAKGKTSITNIAHAKLKESDRIESPKIELEKMGIKVDTSDNSLIIHGGNPHGAIINTYGDHRMAMAFSIAGSKISRMIISDPDVVNKTFPDFWTKLEEIGVKTKDVNEKNIVLIGMRGSGKSTIARMLAKKLGRHYYDLDQLLAEKTGMKIPEIVSKHGWDYFRDKEEEIVKEISGKTNVIISTGGGVILRKTNIHALKKNGLFVFLDAPVRTLLKRIGDDKVRAPLTDKKTKREEMETVWNDRKELYRDSADVTADTSTSTKKDVINYIIQNL